MDPRASEKLADRYRIEREVGAGGMATVYLAHDLRHDRKVALKVLKPELAAVIGAQRFLAEIRTTANLQHPHILPLHDSGEVDGTVFYVMPFVEGESLRDRLTREKQLPIDDALRIATEVADALQYAHSHGVIHRDIKPENILLHGGHGLVADFGIALAASNTAGTRMTETGMSLGTPTYMSPEQAMGERTLDARTDIYALGCVLYEMLLGEAPFSGPTAQAIVAKVLTEKPAALAARRDRVPPHVEAAVLTALEKLPADRFASAAKFAHALAMPSAATPVVARAAATRVSRRALLAGFAAVAIAAITGGYSLGRLGAPSPPAVTRYSIALGGSQGLSASGGSHMAWSPDGRAFVFAAFDGNRSSQLWLRNIDSLTAAPIAGTDGAYSPVFSPDGSQIAFLRTSPFSLNVVPRGGGRVIPIVEGKDVSAGGAYWSDDQWIYFDGASRISRVHPDGTGREDLYVLDPQQKEAGIAWPQPLDGGRALLFRVRREGDDVSSYTIDGYDVRSHRRTRIVRASFARYMPSGHLLYVTADGALMASRFDLKRLELTGTAVTIARGLSVGSFGASDVAVSSSGTLLYSVGHGATTTEPTWISREGRPFTFDLQLTSSFSSGISLAPDGSRLALSIIAPRGSSPMSTEDVWVKTLPSGPMSRLTFEGDRNRRPQWSHDGRDLYFVSSRLGPAALYRQRADGTTPAVRVVSLEEGVGLGFDSPDGKWVIAQNEETAKGGDIYSLRVGVDSVLKPLVASPFSELSPSLSPDGKWLAYQSDETGRTEIYVRPFPNVDAGKIQISTLGGSAPRWSHKGDEIFFQTPSQDMYAARVRSTPTFGVISMTRLFSWLGYFSQYDVSRDDSRFVMLRSGMGSGEKRGALEVIVVENFLTELKRLVP